jgi:tetratricopeptide (TPR) repeat protein
MNVRAVLLVIAVLTTPSFVAAQAPQGDAMMNMQEIAQGLGVKCEYCHGGPRTRADASQPATRIEIGKAMIEMTRDLNAKVQAATGKPPNQVTRVTCVTCHRGVAIPGQLPDILTKTALQKGPDAAVAQYRELREQYYGRQSYDFGEETLLTAAQQIVRSKPDESIPILRLNLEFYPRSVRSYSQIAFAQTRTLKDEEAIATLEKALELEPENGMIKGQIEQLKSYRRKR